MKDLLIGFIALWTSVFTVTCAILLALRIFGVI